MKTLDTRDLQERLEELEEIQENYEDAAKDLETAKNAIEQPSEGETEELEKEKDLEQAQSILDGRPELDEEEKKELEELLSLKDEISEWQYGNTLILESDFEDYCKELCEEIGDLPKDLPGYIVIDWGETAVNLRADYSECEYLGETYLYRNC